MRPLYTFASFSLICSMIIGLLVINTSCKMSSEPDNLMDRYDVIWNSPSKDATGVMPLGNGDIAAGVYAIENDDLYLLLSKNDAYNYMGDIFKTGRVRVSLTPNPFKAGKPFKQTLDLATGSIKIEADGVSMRIWADANSPVYHVEIDSPDEIAVSVKPDLWKRIDRTPFNEIRYYSDGVLDPSIEPVQDVVVEKADKILWYYTVGDRSVYSDDLKLYEVEHMKEKFQDPYRYNTFGNLLESPQLKSSGSTLAGSGKNFDIRIHALTMQTPKPSEWIETIEQQAVNTMAVKNVWKNHCNWWSDFWDRSWIVATDNTLPIEVREKLSGEVPASGMREEEDGAAIISQSYNVFRFLMACQSRGKVQAKFNGGLFTQQLKLKEKGPIKRAVMKQQKDGWWLTNEDDRLWGRRFTFQNQRLLYWPLLASGDFEMMQPFFGYYSNLLEMRKAITKAWFGHDGAYFRENIEPTGAERDCGETNGRPPKTKPGENNGIGMWYHSYYFTSGLEAVTMMTEYVKYSGDKIFRDDVLLPFAREVLLFFDKHYLRDENGKIRLDPAMVLETWWIAINPAPDVAGLQFCLDQLLSMKVGTDMDQSNWTRFRNEIPEISLRTIDGEKSIAPAEKWSGSKKNFENGLLYPVFPFRCFGLGLGSGDIVNNTMKHRPSKDVNGGGCWTQDQIHWAYAGEADKTAEGLDRRFRTASTMCRFPLYGKEGPDSCPDFDHFGSGSTALQRMLIQEEKGKIIVLPAWPKKWDVNFKLHAENNTTVEGIVKDGKLTNIKVTPKSRLKDLEFGEGWSLVK